MRAAAGRGLLRSGRELPKLTVGGEMTTPRGSGNTMLLNPAAGAREPDQ